MASGFGAGAGADMLQDILRRKLVEQAQMAQQAQHAATLAEAARRADQVNTLGNRQVDVNESQFKELAPQRIAGLAHTNASTESLNRQPVEAQKQRDFSASQQTGAELLQPHVGSRAQRPRR
jgi:hypothetical protein